MRLAFVCGGFLLVLVGSGEGTAQQIGVAQDQPIEEIVVTGSYIRGALENAALPVDVLTREDLEAQGDPSIVEMTRNLSYTSGNSGENGFEGSSSQFATMNLRGLGFTRTRILMDGKRFSLDVNAIPRIAIGRVEVLKDGAAVLYGSDAMAGVVNFITRDRFDGLEMRASYQQIKGSDGDGNLAAIVGHDSGRVHWSVAAEWDKRGDISTTDRHWALRPEAENPEGGWSFIGQPGSYLPAVSANPPGIIGFPRPDPQCGLLGGEPSGPVCLFQYTPFFNLVNEQETVKLFAELEVDVNDSLTFYTQGLLSSVEARGIDVDDLAECPAGCKCRLVEDPPHVPVSLASLGHLSRAARCRGRSHRLPQPVFRDNTHTVDPCALEHELPETSEVTQTCRKAASCLFHTGRKHHPVCVELHAIGDPDLLGEISREIHTSCGAHERPRQMRVARTVVETSSAVLFRNLRNGR